MSILGTEACKIIDEQINNDTEMLQMYSQAFKDIKKFIDNEYKEEIRLNKAILETDRFIDHETEEWRTSYMLGYHDGKMKLFDTLTNLLNILSYPCAQLYNKKWAESEKEMRENGAI